MDKYKGILKNTFIFGMGIVLSKVIISLMLPLYTRVLSTAEYGNAELLVNISAVAVPICSAAIPSAVAGRTSGSSTDDFSFASLFRGGGRI